MKVVLTNKTKYVLPDTKILKKIAKRVLKFEGYKPKNVVVGVFYVGEEEIHNVNKQYRKKDKPTDVITFRLIENPEKLPFTKQNFVYDFDAASGGVYIGEIFICAEVAENQAKEWGNSTNREVAELFVHGMLHILGHDHEEEKERRIMKESELAHTKFLDKLIKN